jgi:hypothetical protein
MRNVGPVADMAALLRTPQFAREKLCHLLQSERVRTIAVDTSEFTSSGFDQHKVHWLIALGTRRRWEIFGHMMHPGSGGSAKLPVTDDYQNGAAMIACAPFFCELRGNSTAT